MDACRGADLVTTDVWTSMGWEAENDERLKAFADWQVDADMMAVAKSDAVFMHCLPAHRGEEVTAGVIDGPQSVVWDEAEKPPACAEGADGISAAGKNRIMNIAYFKDMDTLYVEISPKTPRRRGRRTKASCSTCRKTARRRHRDRESQPGPNLDILKIGASRQVESSTSTPVPPINPTP